MDAQQEFPRYDAYQDSSIDWVGDIPSHWDTQKGKWLFEKKERPVRPEDDIVTAFRDGMVTLRSNRRTEGFTNAVQEHGYQGIRKGDLVIHAMDAFAGAIGVSDSDGKATPVYAACVNRGEFETNSQYFAYLLRFMSKAGYIEALAKGIRERSTDFRFNDFGKLLLPLPPKAEQDRIANFLDQKTAEIDEAIAKKQRLIELLKEQKAILINQAVTKGLTNWPGANLNAAGGPQGEGMDSPSSPDVPMRDSGMEWIGEIPEHWHVKRIKNISSFVTSGPRGWSGYFCDEGPYFLQSGNLTDSVSIDLSKATHVQAPRGADGRRTLLRDNDVLVCITGANTGRVAIARLTDEDVFINQHLCLIRPTAEIDSEFLAYCLHSNVGKTFFFLQQYGLKEGLGLDDIKNAFVLIPPYEEQKAIASKILFVLDSTDEATQGINDHIAALNEYKQTVIASAVTGKLKL